MRSVINTGILGLILSVCRGLSAQNNLNPRSTFENHAIVKFAGKYYDPSYGSEGGKSKNDWESLSLSGYGHGGRIMFSQNGSVRQICWLRNINNSSLQVNITP